MSAGLIALHVFIFFIVLLVMTNGFLHGRAKQKIDAALSVTWLGALVIAALVFGWKAGLAALGASFVYGVLTRPIGRSLATWALNNPPR